jgi:hypothetical protein
VGGSEGGIDTQMSSSRTGRTRYSRLMGEDEEAIILTTYRAGLTILIQNLKNTDEVRMGIVLCQPPMFFSEHFEMLLLSLGALRHYHSRCRLLSLALE